MSRIRTVKPELFEDEELAEKPLGTRLLFIALFTMADREGRLEDRPRIIKLKAFPWDEVEIDAMLWELAPKFIVRYRANEKRYIEIPNFLKHQRPHPKEAMSKIPPSAAGQPLDPNRAGLLGGGNPTPNGSNREKDGPDREKVVPGREKGIPRTYGGQTGRRTEGKENRGEGKESNAPSSAQGADSKPPPSMILEFPVVGSGAKTWNLMSDKLKEYHSSYPGLDVLSVCRHARQWCIDNPKKRKTPRGMPGFLTGWLGREQNSGRPRGEAGGGRLRDLGLARPSRGKYGGITGK